MRIGLHDADKNKFPNLALMKISAWHKRRGDDVVWWNPMERCDEVYSSKVFTFTPQEPMLPENTIKGGTGYGLPYTDLPDEIDAMFPDYSIYPDVDYAVGFLTRGCIRKCPWCVVPKKEGQIRPYRSWHDVKRVDSRDIVFMDNNVLASDYGIAEMEDMIGEDVRAVKDRLVELGYLHKSTHNLMGYDSRKAVKAFQKANGLEVDGIVGPLTWKALF